MKAPISNPNTSYSVAILNAMMIEQRLDIANVGKMLQRLEAPLAGILPPALVHSPKIRGYENWEVARFMDHYEYNTRKNNRFLREVYRACESYIHLIPHLESMHDETLRPPVEDNKPINTVKKSGTKKSTAQTHKTSNTRNSNSILHVTYPNGRVVCHPTAVDTLMVVVCDAIEKFGMKRVYELKLRRRHKSGNSVGLIVMGIPLGQHSKSYKQIPGHPQYYIRTQTDTQEKAWELKDLSDGLGLGLKIRIIEPKSRKA